MKAIRILALSAVVALAACSKNTTDKPDVGAAKPASPPAFTVNGKPVSPEFLEAYTKMLAGGKASSELTADDREAVKENLARIELIAQQAEKDGLIKDPEIVARLEIARLDLIQKTVAQKYLKEHEPTEAELRAEYEAQIAAAPLVQYKARHILVSGEDIAQKIIDQLRSGANFSDLAKRMSAHKESARNGGDLGWFGPNAFDPQFIDAVALLKKGEFTRTPVQTKFGWHVVKLDDTRDVAPPSFDEAKQKVAQLVLTRKFKVYSDEMLKTAKIEPPLTTTPAQAAPAAAAPPPNVTDPAAPPPTAPAAN
jgi:peptidyl-prolyl cis-trans isomerase C